ncbi:hypothetical protein KEJ39_08940 [Candidatus Bathyarchaeota archaeon]|nr:hypothetical protein [Candidatus Bathyarchaeota archaeon]
MMALFHEEVRTEEAKREIPFSLHVVARDQGILIESGITGDATRATRGKGEMMLKLLVDEISNLTFQLESCAQPKNA